MKAECMCPDAIAALLAERDRYRERYEQERTDRQLLQIAHRHAVLTIAKQKEMLHAARTQADL